ncbi:hypothetical protein GCM10027280_57090 [Micromonospora polyrhachis]|uniref:Type VII secretion-associated serine protease mycosin n=1 Tax=Micromonospora polyrhachis TaxID=1282883 RepID=A0A7W7SSN0_9ACTN|nr:type VII secretion-associated serine protease mycosin [Micromonospora polyrhachis]MBB4960232.1 type VII secretion-associated serine protease mycosin [Micromonospora polyrhachis]
MRYQVRSAARCLGLLLAAAIGTATGALGVAVPGSADVACSTPAEPGQVASQLPPEQLMLGFRRAWPVTIGTGITVAVIGTGVDDDHPQLRGGVGRGLDLVTGSPDGRTDCVSHGTAMASLIAARSAPGTGFVGVAPGATILPVRITERGEMGQAETSLLARAITWAVDHGAKVVNVSLVTPLDTTELRAAVRYASERDVLLVAAAGSRPDGAEDPGSPDLADPPWFPSAYPGVLSVGAVAGDGVRLASSPVSPEVDVVAPGGALVAATRQRGHAIWSGTSVAAALASGVAALIRSAEPGLTAAEVERRMVATANQIPGGTGSGGYTHGMVDPYRAVTETTAAGGTRVLPDLPPRTADLVAERAAARWRSARHSALVIGLCAGLLVLGTVLAVGVRRRRTAGRPRGTGIAGPGWAGPAVEPDLPELTDSYFAVPKPPARTRG